MSKKNVKKQIKYFEETLLDDIFNKNEQSTIMDS